MPSPIDEGALEALVEEVLVQQLNQVERAAYVLKVPPLRDYVMESPGLHFHFNPEFVIGLNGKSTFAFVSGRFVLGPREMAVLPAGIPHNETPSVGLGVFQNIVVSVYNQTVCVQLQHQRGRQGLQSVQRHYDTPKFSLLASYLNEIAEFHLHSGRASKAGIKGLLLAYMGTLAGILEQSKHRAPVEKLKISQVKKLVQEHLASTQLSVRMLAGLLHCSPDYLSHLFHQETGLYLISYINAERIRAARELLQGTSLNISEVAFAVGFENPAYFSQVFKQFAFKTPQQYRRTVEHSVIELEGRPRTIYAGN